MTICPILASRSYPSWLYSLSVTELLSSQQQERHYRHIMGAQRICLSLYKQYLTWLTGVMRFTKLAPPNRWTYISSSSRFLWSVGVNHSSLGADCNLYVSHLKNKHIKCCQLPAPCRHACYQAIIHPAAPTICLSKRHKTQRQVLALEVFLNICMTSNFAPNHDECRSVPRGKEKLIVTQMRGMYSSVQGQPLWDWTSKAWCVQLTKFFFKVLRG